MGLQKQNLICFKACESSQSLQKLLFYFIRDEFMFCFVKSAITLFTVDVDDHLSFSYFVNNIKVLHYWQLPLFEEIVLSGIQYYFYVYSIFSMTSNQACGIGKSV